MLLQIVKFTVGISCNIYMAIYQLVVDIYKFPKLFAPVF